MFTYIRHQETVHYTVTIVTENTKLQDTYKLPAPERFWAQPMRRRGRLRKKDIGVIKFEVRGMR